MYGTVWAEEETEILEAYSNNVSPRRPLISEFLQGLKANPHLPPAFDDERLKQRTQEQCGGENQNPQGVCQAERPVAHGVEDIARRGRADMGEHVEGRQRADDTGQRDGGDAGADDGGRIAGEVRRWPRLGGEIEGGHIDERVDDLGDRSTRCPGIYGARPGPGQPYGFQAGIGPGPENE